MLRAAPDQPRRVLLVTTVLPWPLHRNGGAQRTDLLRKALEQSGCRVDILALVPQPGPDLPGEHELRRHGVIDAFPIDVALATRPRPRYVPAGFGSIWSLSHVRRVWRRRYAPAPEVQAWLRQREERYDAIVVRYLQTALLAGLDRRSPLADPPVVVDMDDVDWLTLRSRLDANPWPGIVGRIGMFIAYHTVRSRCRRALPSFRTILVTNEEDLRELKGLGDDPMLLPNIPYGFADTSALPVDLPPPAQRPVVLFVGDLEFGPNVTGLDWFLKECWRSVRISEPQATLRVVGRGLAQEQRQRWEKIQGIEVVGFAEDLRAEYARAACCIAPTWWGGGTKIKVVEAAAMGRPSVATPHALRGHEYLAAGPSPGAISAANASEFVAGVGNLLQNPALRQSMASAALVLAHRGLGFEGFKQIVARSLLEATAAGAGGR